MGLRINNYSFLEKETWEEKEAISLYKEYQVTNHHGVLTNPSFMKWESDVNPR